MAVFASALKRENEATTLWFVSLEQVTSNSVCIVSSKYAGRFTANLVFFAQRSQSYKWTEIEHSPLGKNIQVVCDYVFMGNTTYYCVVIVYV